MPTQGHRNGSTTVLPSSSCQPQYIIDSDVIIIIIIITRWLLNSRPVLLRSQWLPRWTSLLSLHMGRHIHFLGRGGANLLPTTDVLQQWLISHNIGIGDKQKSRVLYLHYIRSVIDYYNKRGSGVNLCTLDISEAFDKVNHYCMFIKLTNHSVPVVL